MQCLVPMWDALNHVTDQANVRLNHDAEQGSLVMIATRDISKGDEMINDYGPLSNGELLRRYGAVARHLPFNTRSHPPQLTVRHRSVSPSAQFHVPAAARTSLAGSIDAQREDRAERASFFTM